MQRLSIIDRLALTRLLLRYGLDLRVVPEHTPIPGSYWGESEAGLRGTTLFARVDTPLHSLLHESAHFICMSPERRVGLDRDAGGDDAEEAAVCWLQVQLARSLDENGVERLCQDMDEWGYSFRLGSTRAWLEQDAEDSRAWLIHHGILDAHGALTYALRG